ncbi:catechol 2,3-dioxygenase-like lactoylglutathione lyase family enzyme [Arthrobacter sp. 1088]|uniref:VOC family protein n=1 Tax=unclassified Arthrobacter TaxID=235627 RepID=UPI001CC6F86C|nr:MULTISPECIES: VOC family protein [unclassified Arthrobacter]MDR6687992.1 catechol 2,3-dioxygenase-like lactoylglutathione lyase family enzyme [Arthrobacter sp. 1088]
MRLKMCSIHVKDPATAHAFYTETLGFETLMAMPEHNLFIIKDPGADNSADNNSVGLLLEPSDNPIGANYMNAVHDAGLPAIVFGVPDVQAEYERLVAAGVTFKGEPSEDPSGISAVFDDGCGNFVQLHQD